MDLLKALTPAQLVQPLHHLDSMTSSARLKTVQRLWTLFRALVAGGGATLVDLVVLALLVDLLAVPARVASIPALVAGGTVAFVANRRWVFHARAGSIVKQASLFVLVELFALALNGLLYELAMRSPTVSHQPQAYLVVRLVTSHVVFLGWSYPLWRLVFRDAPDRVDDAPSPHQV